MRGSSALVALFLVVGGASFVANAPVSATTATSTLRWVDQNVTFQSGGMTIYATYRHPVNSATKVPGALLIAGSGPTDRNGNSNLESGSINTLKTLADWFSDDGVATLRYDKLGSGKTGLGPYAAHPDTIGISVFEQESRSALEFLAAQKDVNPNELGVFGHSEGALFALLLATGHAGPVPAIHAVGLLEPLSIRYLDLISDQVDASLSAQVKSKAITKKLEKTVKSIMAKAILQIRTKGTVAANLPYGLASILNPGDALFLSQTDKYDPETLAAQLTKHTEVFDTCSNDDIQVSCKQVDHMFDGFIKSKATLDFVYLTGVDHVLKVDSSKTGNDYTKNLPFSPYLKKMLAQFAAYGFKKPKDFGVS
jgi:pimeloyl-ACP methyl ester carboxylesterase